MKKIIFALCFFMPLSGCGWYEAAKDQISPPSAEEIEERRLKAEESEKERVQKIKDADALVQDWAEDLHSKTDKAGGYLHHEGLTESDPWGQFLEVQYRQDVWHEVLTVTSPGPDHRMGTHDDLIRERRFLNVLGVFSGVSAGVIVLVAWPLVALLAFFLFILIESKRKKRGKSKKERNVALAIFCSLAFAPVVFLWNCFVYFGLVCVDRCDLDTDFFDGGIDVDFDLDILD